MAAGVDREAFVRADSLSVGEQLQTLNGIARVTSITARGPPEPVYNLEVQVKHTYFDADPGVLVHNGNKCNVDLQDAINDDVANKGIHIKVDGQELRLRIRNTDAEDLDDWVLDFEAALPAQAADKKLQKAIRNI